VLAHTRGHGAEQPTGPGGMYRIAVAPFEAYLAQQGYTEERVGGLRKVGALAARPVRVGTRGSLVSRLVVFSRAAVEDR
jgi:hypothetical protein